MIVKKPLVPYMIISFFLILLLWISNCAVFSIFNADHLIKLHIGNYMEAVNEYAENHPAVYSVFIENNNTAENPPAESLSDKLRKKKSIFKVSLWNNNRMLVWDDRGSVIINKTSSREFNNACEGTAGYNITLFPTTIDPANIAPVLNIFIPVIRSGKVIGVAEIHEKITAFYMLVKKSFQPVWLIALAGCSLLYVTLFFIFFNASRRQKNMLDKLEQTQNVTIFALAYQAELRDLGTGKHLERAVFYVQLLVEELRKNKKYQDYITDQYITDLIKSAPIHDIGKVGVPDSILNKPGPLTAEEYETMKQHCTYAVMVIEKALTRLSHQSFLDIAMQLVKSHHEKWDGSGYPNGLSKEDIPLSGRIMALADVYDALRSRRPYKDSFHHDECMKIILEGSGKHFDPEVVNAFLLHEREFLKISQLLSD